MLCIAIAEQPSRTRHSGEVNNIGADMSQEDFMMQDFIGSNLEVIICSTGDTMSALDESKCRNKGQYSPSVSWFMYQIYSKRRLLLGRSMIMIMSSSKMRVSL